MSTLVPSDTNLCSGDHPAPKWYLKLEVFLSSMWFLEFTWISRDPLLCAGVLVCTSLQLVSDLSFITQTCQTPAFIHHSSGPNIGCSTPVVSVWPLQLKIKQSDSHVWVRPSSIRLAKTVDFLLWWVVYLSWCAAWGLVKPDYPQVYII